MSSDVKSNKAVNLWDKLIEEKAAAKIQQKQQLLSATESTTDTDNAKNRERLPVDTNILWVGPRSGGKTSLIQSFLSASKSDETPKPSVALEYSFWRKSAASSSSQKDICHVWELAGGRSISELAKIPITPDRLLSLTVAIVIDLSKPGDVVLELIRWILLIRERVSEAMSALQSIPDGREIAELLKDRAKKRYATDHDDLKIVDPCPVPLVILANKYDSFKDHEGPKRKIVAQALRYIAHVNGATLLTVSVKEKNLVSNFKMVIGSYVFRSEARKTADTEPTKPLVIPAGLDTFTDIGPPKPGRTLADSGALEQRMKAWLPFVAEVFPASADATAEEKVEDTDPAADFPEPAIDSVRAQKEEELIRYRKEAERKAKLKTGDGSADGPDAKAGKALKDRADSDRKREKKDKK